MAEKKETKKRKVLGLQPARKLKEGEEPEKFEFVVRQGKKFGATNLRPGETIELTAEEALPFADKLEPADRGYVLATSATPEELAEAGIVQVANPSPSSTDRNDMTPAQRAETSQTNLETGVGPEPTAGGNISDAGGRSPRTTPTAPSKSEKEKK